VKQTINFLFFERDFGVKNDPLNNTKEHEIALVSFRAISWIVSFFFWLRPGRNQTTRWADLFNLHYDQRDVIMLRGPALPL
jgi:hypothetical protein